MRESPTASSKIVARVPFGELLRITDEVLIKDTLGAFEIASDTGIVSSDLTGHWVKAHYQSIVGFAFDAYLYEVNPELIDEDPRYPALNKDYILQFPWCSCFDNFHFISEMFWYGIFQTSDGAIKAKEIQPRYFINHADDMFSLCISATERRDLIFMIGAKDSLHFDKISGSLNLHTSEDDFNFDNSFHSEFEYNKDNGQLTLMREGKKQILNPDKELELSAAVIWKGDLDGDTKTDYIVQFGIKGSETFLYLSGKADINQIVKPVAVYYNGYCC